MIAKISLHIGNVQKSVYNLTITLSNVIVNFFIQLAAPKNKYWKFQFSSRDILAVALFHQEYSCQKSFPHSLPAKVPLSKKCGYLFKLHLPFHHHLLYNCLVIQDTPLCIL